MCVYVYVCVCVCASVYVCAHVCMYVCVCVFNPLDRKFGRVMHAYIHVVVRAKLIAYLYSHVQLVRFSIEAHIATF